MAYEKNPDDNNIQAAIDAGMALGTPANLDPVNLGSSILGVVVPAGAKFEKIDLEAWLPAPRRKTGGTAFSTALSFIDWVNRNKTPETVIFANEEKTNFTAYFNGHAANVQPAADSGSDGNGFQLGAPGWGDYMATYSCPLSDEWKRWAGKSQHDKERKEGMAHAEFIQFIEDNLLDISKPASGLMLQAVRAFEAKKDLKFASAKRLDNGDVSFAYAEDTQQQTVGGSLALPSVFELTIPVFKGGTAYIIEANLRYRITSGGLFLWYELVRPHKSLEHAFTQAGKQIADGASVPMFST